LGGFVAPVGRWLAFSDEWKAALNQPPALEYFKMKEAARLGINSTPEKAGHRTFVTNESMTYQI
jgi:hypothetical protein